jgi:hypothetical protein
MLDLTCWTTQFHLLVKYVWFWILDGIDCYYTYLILSLPPYVFGPPVYVVKQSEESTDSDDSDDSQHPLDTSVDYIVFVSHLVCIFKNMQDNQFVSRNFSGSQLRPLVNENGRFFIGNLVQFFPTLHTITLTYVKKPRSDPANKSVRYTKIIDVKRRYDVHNEESCMMGVTF